MTFLHPALAWAALGAVALPIVIHLLFRRRRVPVDWAAMDLLREAIRRTNRRLRFEQWLVLVLRALAVLAVGLAIAVPMFGDAIGEQSRERTSIVVVDNGATSALSIGTQTELARLRDEIRASVERSHRSGDRVGIVTAAGEPALILAPTADLAEFDRVLTRITPAETPSDLAGAVRLARESTLTELDGASRVRRVFIASAFRRGSLREGETLQGAAGAPPSTSETNTTSEPLVSASSAASQLQASAIEMLAVAPAVELPTDVRVDRVEARAMPSGGAFLVRAMLTREGASLDAAETRVQVQGDAINTVASRSVRWDSGQTEATVEFQVVPRETMNTQSDRRRGMTVSIDDDVLSVGNTAYTVIDVRREIEVAVVGRRGSLDGADLEKVPGSLWIARALSPGLGVSNGIRVREIDPASCDERALLGVDAVVLARPELVSPSSCDAIGAFVRNGGVAIIVPGGESMAQTWGPTLFSRLGVSMRVGPEARNFETPISLREEQPSSSLLSSITPELPALCAPIEVSRAMTLEGVTGAEAILLFADGTPFVAAQTPDASAGQSSESSSSAERAATSVATPVTTATNATTWTERGLVVCLATSPELSWTNLPVKPLMVPLFQELVRTGVEIASASDEVLVGDRMRGVSAGAVRLADVKRESSTIEVGADGVSASVVPLSGVWKSDGGALIAANIRPSSIALAPTSQESLRAAFEPLGGVRIAERATEDADGVQLTGSATGWWSFALLILGLILLLAEGVLSRIFSHASLARASGRDSGIETVGRVRSRGTSTARIDLGRSRASESSRVGAGGST